MNFSVEPIILDTENIDSPQSGNNIYTSRRNIVSMYEMYFPFQVSIVVTCFNRIEKSKRCIDSIIKYTKDINYELILIDNGSSDDTYEYLQSVPVKNKKIIKVTKNIGAGTALMEIYRIYQGEYLVSVPNDIVVTKNWLVNIIKCYISDEKVGFAVPISTNVSNLQQVNTIFDNYEQIEQFGEKNNISDPKRWKERLRLINTIWILKREIIDLVGSFDYGFFHDFNEDDFCIRVRRAGYKLMLCEDSFIHHDHDFRNMEDKNPEEYRKSLEIGRKNYKDKYYGLDAWEDVNNYEINLINMLTIKQKIDSTPSILGVDTRMGTPILEIKNKLREQGIRETHSHAFTTQAKYFLDLQTICGQNVFCDRIAYLFEYFLPNTFDYIILGEPINQYAQPVKLVQRLIEFTKPGGQILIKLTNINNISKFVQILGGNKFIEDSMLINVEPEELIECAKLIGISSYSCLPEMMNVERETEGVLKSILKDASLTKDIDETAKKLSVENYLICIQK
ncbi:MAG: glycosyltransferase [Clostridiales bacterium]|jgi:GT2 family glycosyltransferase|nr:glycosyltransferase [Clostridiales bacterium]